MVHHRVGHRVVSRLTFREIGLPEGELVILLKARGVSGLKDEDLQNLQLIPGWVGVACFLYFKTKQVKK